MSSSRHNPEFADFTISTQLGTSYKVHRIIISNHSERFARTCSQKCTATLRGYSDQIVELMIDFCYAFDYDAADVSIRAKTSTLDVHARMFAIADEYEIWDLKALALRKFEQDAPNMDSKVEDFVKMVAYA